MTLDETDPLPASGTFRTSWAVQIKWAGGSAGVVLVLLGAMLWLDEDVRDPEVWLFVVGVTAVFWIGWLLWYRLGGVAEVRVTPEAVVVVGHGGTERRIDRAEVVEVWKSKRWTLRTLDQKVTIRNEGFTTADWSALSEALYAWKLREGTIPPGLAPTAPHASEAVVFEVHRPTIPVVAGGVLAVAFLGVGALMWGQGGSGAWREEPMVTVVVPLAGLLFAALVFRMLPTLVRRAVFLPEAVRFERVVGGDRTVAYREITDALGGHVDTSVGTFFVGQRNADVFAHLLDERLDGERLTGRRALMTTLWFQPRVLVGLLLGMVGAWFVASRLGAAWGLEGEWVDLLVVVALLAVILIVWAGVTLWANRLLRDAPA